MIVEIGTTINVNVHQIILVNFVRKKIIARWVFMMIQSEKPITVENRFVMFVRVLGDRR